MQEGMTSLKLYNTYRKEFAAKGNTRDVRAAILQLLECMKKELLVSGRSPLLNTAYRVCCYFMAKHQRERYGYEPSYYTLSGSNILADIPPNDAWNLTLLLANYMSGESIEDIIQSELAYFFRNYAPDLINSRKLANSHKRIDIAIVNLREKMYQACSVGTTTQSGEVPGRPDSETAQQKAEVEKKAMTAQQKAEAEKKAVAAQQRAEAERKAAAAPQQPEAERNVTVAPQQPEAERESVTVSPKAEQQGIANFGSAQQSTEEERRILEDVRRRAEDEKKAILAAAHQQEGAILAAARQQEETILAAARQQAESILVTARQQEESILVTARQQAEFIPVDAQRQADVIVRSAMLKADQKISEAESRIAKMSSEKRLQECEAQRETIQRNFSEVRAELIRTNEMMRALEASMEETNTSKICTQFLELYNLMADTKAYAFQIAREKGDGDLENAAYNIETFMEMIVEYLEDYGIRPIVTEPGEIFQVKFHEVDSQGQPYDPRTAVVKLSKRTGFIWGEVVLQKERVLIE